METINPQRKMESEGTWKFGIVRFKDNMLEIEENQTFPTMPAGNIGTYLVVANPNDKTQTLCISSSAQDIPQEEVKIISIGNFKDKQLGNETLAKKALPSFLQGDNYLA